MDSGECIDYRVTIYLLTYIILMTGCRTSESLLILLEYNNVGEYFTEPNPYGIKYTITTG